MFGRRAKLPSECPRRRGSTVGLRLSELEAIQLHPEIRLRPAFLLHVEAIPRRSRHGGGSPQGWLLGELLSKLVRGPDLTWRYMGLYARGKQDGAPARHHPLGLVRPRARLDVAKMKRHTHEGLARRLVDVVHDLACHLGQDHRIVVDDDDGVTAARLGDERALR